MTTERVTHCAKDRTTRHKRRVTKSNLETSVSYLNPELMGPDAHLDILRVHLQLTRIHLGKHPTLCPARTEGRVESGEWRSSYSVNGDGRGEE